MTLNLRERQLIALSNILSLSGSGPDVPTISNEDFTDQWKVLVYDHSCRDIISPLMNVGALRNKGVTLHLLLDSEREPIPDAPVVYFVRPTSENIKRIVQDCAQQLYRTAYLHFVTKIERPLMEDLAHGLVTNNAASLISKVYDEYLDVISLDANLFTLNLSDSFVSYNDPKMKEADIRQYISRLSIGLVSLVRVLGVLPIIRAPSGPAEMLAQELCNSLRDCLSPRGSAHSIFGDFLVSDRPRPLLLIVDRSSDLSSPLLHASSYLALVDDLLDFHLNKVNVMATPKTGPPTKKTYDLNTQQDPFFCRYACAPFPEAIDAHEKELAAVLKREADIRSSKPSSSSASSDHLDGTGSSQQVSATSLSEAVTSLPEILAKKANLEAHANILQAVMKVVAARDVPSFVELEQTILQSGGSIDKAAVMSLLQEGSKGTIIDRGRLLAFIVLLIQSNDKTAASNALIDEYIAAFTEGCESTKSGENTTSDLPGETAQILSAITFLRKLQKLQSPMGGYGGLGGSSGTEGKSAAMLTNFFSNATRYAANSIMMLAGSTFTALPFTSVVDNLAEGKSCVEEDSYCYLDPRLPANQQGQSRLSGQKYGEVIVFVIGGGCLVEHQNLQDLLQQKRSSTSSSSSVSGGGVGLGSALRNVIYGGSELYSSEGFLKQLYQLGGGV